MALPTVGFIGAGKMGRPMMQRLLASGYEVAAFDRSVTSLASLDHEALEKSSSSADVADRAETVFLSLPSPSVVERICAELATGGIVRTIVDLSTTGPHTSRRVADALSARGIALVDCPVSGGVTGAINGTLAIMVGAKDLDLAAVRPMLECFGRIFHVGPSAGMGQMMKIINNLMSASALAVSAEGVSMAVKAGLDPAIVVYVLNAGSGRSSATLDKFPRQILPGTFDAGFSMELMVKDVTLCMEQAEQMGLDLPASRAVAAIWKAAIERVGPDADFTRIVELAEASAGVRLGRRQGESADG